MRKRLFTYGCSFTAGVELKNREQSSWPVLLSKKMDMDLVNRAVGGASNQRNLRVLIQDLATHQPDYVIFQLTGEQRMELCRNDGSTFRFGSGLKIAAEDKFLNKYIYYKYLNEEFLLNRLLDQMTILTSLLNKTPHKLFFGITYPEKMKQISESFLIYHSAITPTQNILGWPDQSFRSLTQDRFPFGPDDHPLEEAHAFMANYIYEKIE
jgi:hypothetical protein